MIDEEGLQSDERLSLYVSDQINNLPVQLTSLIGREQEVRAACTLLQRADVRLVTLTGTGGIGKTRLGLAMASEMLAIFAGGICFVPLASISDPALVIPTIAHLLGLEHMHTRSVRVDMEYLKTFLQDKHFLLVLDNFEQVVQAAPDLTELLKSCPNLNILVTSRATLHLEGEHEFPVPPLAFPTHLKFPASEDLAQYPAIALFLQRAVRVKPDFALTRANIQAIAAICKHLDGLPLAIELAAARIKVLPPQALLQRLAHRLEVLTGGMQGVAARQQTLRNTIAWSYNLLDAEEQWLFRQLSIFVGGCTLQAVEATCSAFANGERAVLNGVASLIDKSLLRQTEQEGDEPRLLMLETIREFGLDYLASCGEMEQTRLAHAEYYLRLAEETETHLYGAEQVRWFDQLEREHDNLRAALSWSIGDENTDQRRETALRLAAVLVRFWVARGYISEGRDWLEKALARREEVAPPVQANALSGASWLAFLQSDMEQATILYEDGLQCYREARKTHHASVLVPSLIGLTWMASMGNHDAAARFLLDESRALARETGDNRSLAHLLNFLAVAAIQQGNFTEAHALLEESLAHFKEMDNQFDMAWSLRFLGQVLFPLREKARAYALVEEGLALSRAMHDIPGQANSLYLLGRFSLEEGNAVAARARLEESLALFRMIGVQHHIAHLLPQLANSAMQQGDYEAAHGWYKESQEMLQELDDREGMVLCLQGWGVLVARRGEGIAAARLWGVAETLRHTRSPRVRFLMFVRHTNYEQADYERMVGLVRVQLGEKIFAAAWAEGQNMTPEQALAKQEPARTGKQAPPAPPIPAYPAGLTAREIQVLRLVAKGLTNSDIAEELEISEKTIAHHLTHIFNKTTSENRAAAAAFAIRHGLA